MVFLKQPGASSPLARALGLATLALAAAVAWPSPAAAHVACCVQCWNPHGGTIPPAGSAIACDPELMPSDNADKAGFNPDGFFLVGTALEPGGTCGGPGTSDAVLFSCDLVYANGQLTCPTANRTEIGTFESPTYIKYTEANGAKTPTVDDMAGNNAGGFGGGQAEAVQFRIKASGDLVVCNSENLNDCAICPVPAPPK